MEDLKWFGHASFSITDNKSGIKILYIDPFEMPEEQTKGDIIFVTHAHHDHLSPKALLPLLKEDSIVVATRDSLEKLDINEEQKHIVVANKNYEVKGISFSTIPAYNTYKEKQSYHPQKNGWVGYIINVNNKKIYHAGDTDFITEMKDLESSKLDVAILPMGGTYTMDVEDMIQAANAIKAKITIPMHYRHLLGEQYKAAEERIKKEIINSKVLILEELK